MAQALPNGSGECNVLRKEKPAVEGERPAGVSPDEIPTRRRLCNSSFELRLNVYENVGCINIIFRTRKLNTDTILSNYNRKRMFVGYLNTAFSISGISN